MAVEAAIRPVENTPVRRPRRRVSGAAVIVLFTGTGFLGAALLFVVQPMVARLMLPAYGGSATVWSTSSLFFQVLLLLAYWYVHWSTKRWGRWQPRGHLAVLVLPLAILPLAMPTDAAPSSDVSPVLWLLRTLFLMVGIPFLVVATTGPVLQKWYSWTGNRRSDDPYFLYAASNLGSFGGLLAYPFLIERTMSVDAQRAAWSWAFVIFAVLTACCALVAARGRSANSMVTSALQHTAQLSRVEPGRIMLWMGLAFLPSSLLLGVTAHLSTDVAAMPLLWVVPLAIYLATFVLAFGRTSRTPPMFALRAATAMAFVAAIAVTVHGAVSISVSAIVSLAMLALVAYGAHARLAADRPDPEQLTTFYLVISAGGALGGLLNGLVAPVIFETVLEYPLALMAVPLLLLGVVHGGDGWLARQFAANRVRTALMVLLIALVPLSLRFGLWFLRGQTVVVLLTLIVLFVVAWWLSRHPVALAVGLAVLFGATTLSSSRIAVEETRTFYGSYKVTEAGGLHQLVHGTTVHGTQFMDAVRRETPTTYYSRSGPLGDVFTELDGGFDNVAAVGLGTGTIAAYGRSGQTMTFFEIDPEIIELASDPTLFSYLDDSAADIDLVAGDGRLALADYPSRSFDLVVLDAFSSDAIPVHLLTTDAMRIYADRLTSQGVLAVHISNRVFDLEPVVASAAQKLGWDAAIGHSSSFAHGATPSAWIVLSSNGDAIDELLQQPGWSHVGDRQVTWTDDYSSILTVLR